MLSQFPCLQVVEKQGHFALFAQAWAAHGGWGARATRAQTGGKEGEGIIGAQGGAMERNDRVMGGTEWGRADSQVGGISQAPLG